MPRYVDHDGRRREIVRATVTVLANKGLAGLTIRAVAEQLGGSVTLVTHYYRSRDELINDLAVQLTAGWSETVADLDAGSSDPAARMRALLVWALPATEDQMLIERARLQLLAARDEFPAAGDVFAAWDDYMRGLFREHLEELVPGPRIEPTVDVLRAVVTGITFEAYQHGWPVERQHRVLSDVLDDLGIVSVDAS
ncbi:TetR/AcrR family transcriptional regulator [Nocardioides sp.]|uniref:TetR/AcrR family transcriptional regulator n=1 Tax=Nocardioides sp. TaxID=35761 RepID=UPI003783B5C5